MRSFGFTAADSFPLPLRQVRAVRGAGFHVRGMENITAVTKTITSIFPPDARALTITDCMPTNLRISGLAIRSLPSWPHAGSTKVGHRSYPRFWDREKEGLDAYDLTGRHLEGGSELTTARSVPSLRRLPRSGGHVQRLYLTPWRVANVYVNATSLESPFWTYTGRYLTSVIPECRYASLLQFLLALLRVDLKRLCSSGSTLRLPQT